MLILEKEGWDAKGHVPPPPVQNGDAEVEEVRGGIAHRQDTSLWWGKLEYGTEKI